MAHDISFDLKRKAAFAAHGACRPSRVEMGHSAPVWLGL